MTTPVVPRIEMPPRMPRRPFSVFSAIVSPSGTEISTSKSAVIAGRLGDCLGDHLARHRIDRRLAGRDRQAGPRHRADAGAGLEGDAGAGRAAPDRRAQQRAMRHVGIVAGILDHAGPCKAFAELPFGEREGGASAAGQSDLDRVGEFAGDQRRAGGLRRRGGAGAGRPAASQMAGRFVHAMSYRRVSPHRVSRHGQMHGRRRNEP